MKMVRVGMYADQTGLFSESEIYYDNWCEVEIPEWIVRKWYEKEELAEETADELNIPIEEATFEKWLNEVSYGDDTDGLYNFAVECGYTPVLGINKRAMVFYRDDCNYKYIVFEGTYDECRNFGKEMGWEFNGEELEILDIGGK